MIYTVPLKEMKRKNKCNTVKKESKEEKCT
jgi:hypothetical protein